MQKIVVGFSLMLIVSIVNAQAISFPGGGRQVGNPVKWAYTAKKLADKTYELHISATIDGNWHLYAQDAGEGPEPTRFRFSLNPLISFEGLTESTFDYIEGQVKEVGKLEKSYDPNFKSTLKYYTKKVDFVQKITLKTNVATVVKGTVYFMVCNDRQCLPPKTIPFTIKVGGK